VKSESKNPKDPPQIELNVLLDTGANCNIMSARFEHHFNISNFTKRRVRFATTTNSQLASVCKVSFNVQNNGILLEFSAEFLICDIVEDMILGNPFLRETGIIYLCLEGSAENPFSPQVHHLEELFGDQEGENEFVGTSDGAAFDVDTEDLWLSFAKLYGLESSALLFNVIVFYALHSKFPIGDFHDRIHDVIKLMQNVSDHSFVKSDIPFMKRAYHADAPFKELNKAVEIITNALNMIWDISNIGVANFRCMDVDFDMTLFKSIHKKQPVQSLNEPMSRYLEDFLNRLRSRNMLRKVPVEEIPDIITVSSSYLIPKHTPGKFRFIVDMLKSGVNSATRPISYPTPDLHEHLDFSAGFDVVSTADGCDFYFQMPISPESYKYFTIVTKFGYDQFMTLPQGSRNACQHVALCTSETLMSENLSRNHKCYFDDFHTRSMFGNGSLKYRDALLRLVEFHCYGLRYNIKFDIFKAKLCFAALELLGFTIDKQGKRISASRVEALRNLRKPRSRDDVQKLLGCFVFVAKWIKNFAEFSAPLYSLLHKGVRFEKSWSVTHDECLMALRHCVENAPILIVLNYSEMVYFRSDASLLAIAAVLYQIVEDKELPACYGSKKLTDHQKSWPIVQTEFYSLIYFIRKWRSMLQGAQVTIEVDARNLLWARNSSNEMIRRWSYEVDSYIDVVKVVHIPGISNEPVDSMSRFVDEDPDSKLVVSSTTVSLDMEYSVSVLMDDQDQFFCNQCAHCNSCVNEILLTIDEIDALTDPQKLE
jgi:hypothetical protein